MANAINLATEAEVQASFIIYSQLLSTILSCRHFCH